MISAGFAMLTIDKPSNNTDDAKAERNVVPHMRVFVGVQVAPEIARELDPMIAGPEGGPSSDMQRYEG